MNISILSTPRLFKSLNSWQWVDFSKSRLLNLNLDTLKLCVWDRWSVGRYTKTKEIKDNIHDTVEFGDGDRDGYGGGWVEGLEEYRERHRSTSTILPEATLLIFTTFTNASSRPYPQPYHSHQSKNGVNGTFTIIPLWLDLMLMNLHSVWQWNIRRLYKPLFTNYIQFCFFQKYGKVILYSHPGR